MAREASQKDESRSFPRASASARRVPRPLSSGERVDGEHRLREEQCLGLVREAQGLSVLRPARLVEALSQASECGPGLLALPELVIGQGQKGQGRRGTDVVSIACS